MDTYIIGFGSLLNEQSLKRTCPTAKILRPVWLEGWQRHCETPSVHYHGEHGPFCVMDVSPKGGERLNAVLIAIPDTEMDALREREKQYAFIKTPCTPWPDGDIPTIAYVCSMDAKRIAPNWDHPQQMIYLMTCMQGCRDISPTFLQDFLATTFLDEMRLLDHPRLPALLSQLDASTEQTAYGYIPSHADTDKTPN